MNRSTMWQRIRRWPARLRELRSTLRNPAEWLLDAFTGGSAPAAGIRVGPSQALTLSAYFAAIRAISEDIAKLPLVTYRRLKPQGKERVPEYPLYTLLHDAPNPEMTSMAFRETLTQHAIGWGNGYAEIEWAGNTPKALWPLDPTQVEPKRDSVNGELYYLVRGWNGKPDTTLRMENMFHLHGLGYDGITGYSVAQLARESLSTAAALEQSAGGFFGNGSRPGGILETPNKLGNEGRRNLRESWEEAHGGAANAGRTAVLEQGVQFKTISISNKDAQWIEARQFSVEEFCRWTRVPPHKVAQLLHATFTNIAHQDLEYHGDALMPWEVRWEQEAHRKLIPKSERSTYFVEHVTAAVLRSDTATRYAAYATARVNGWMSANKILELENLNPIGKQGDIYWMPANMMDASKVNDPPPETTPAPAVEPTDDANGDNDRAAPAGVREALRPLLEGIYRGLLQVESVKAKAAEAAGRIDEWQAVWLPEHEMHVQGKLAAAFDLAGAVRKLNKYEVREMTARAADRHIERLREATNSGTSVSELVPKEIADTEMRTLF